MLTKSLKGRNNGVHCVAVNCAVVVAVGRLLCWMDGALRQRRWWWGCDTDHQIALSRWHCSMRTMSRLVTDTHCKWNGLVLVMAIILVFIGVKLKTMSSIGTHSLSQLPGRIIYVTDNGSQERTLMPNSPATLKLKKKIHPPGTAQDFNTGPTLLWC